MGFGEAIRSVFIEKYVTFSGRAPRSEYWYSLLGVTLLMLVLYGLAFATGTAEGLITGNMSGGSMIFLAILGLVYLAMILPLIAVSVRRLHDRDMSGWWYLGVIIGSAIPFVGIVVSIGWIVLCCLKGTDGENRFGSDPLNPSANADVFS